MAIPSEDLKICSLCRKPKPPTEFYTKKSGIQLAECKRCTKDRNDRWRARPEVKANHLVYWKARRAKTKAAVFAAYGGKCACCGETEMCFLSIDHIHNDGAKFRKEVLGNRAAAGFHTYRWLVLHEFPEGYQVLCMNCQWGKKMNGGICPHQVTRNDYPLKGVPASAGKRSLPDGEIQGKDIVCPSDESGSSFIN